MAAPQETSLISAEQIDHGVNMWTKLFAEYAKMAAAGVAKVAEAAPELLEQAKGIAIREPSLDVSPDMQIEKVGHSAEKAKAIAPEVTRDLEKEFTPEQIQNLTKLREVVQAKGGDKVDFGAGDNFTPVVTLAQLNTQETSLAR